MHRRGHGDSTGLNLDGVADANDPCALDGSCAPCTDSACDLGVIGNLCRQVADVRQAVIKMLSLRNYANQRVIDPSRIAILGHSLGGIITVCSNTQNLGQRTVVDIAGASENWVHYDMEDGGPIDGHSPAIAKLNSFVLDHVTPPMFLQPMNDCSTVPTDQFTLDLLDQDQLVEGTLFPNVTFGTTFPYGPPIPASQCKTAHASFVFNPYWVNKWGPSVEAWLNRMFADPSTINTAPAGP
jgi:hypothetical protein